MRLPDRSELDKTSLSESDKDLIHEIATLAVELSPKGFNTLAMALLLNFRKSQNDARSETNQPKRS